MTLSLLERFTVSMDQRLLDQFDKRNKFRGYPNRSEAIRDLIRHSLVQDEWKNIRENVAATLTMVFDFKKADLQEKFQNLNDQQAKLIVASLHVPLDAENCLEVIVLRGKQIEVSRLAEYLIAQKGVKHGDVVYTTEGKNLF